MWFIPAPCRCVRTGIGLLVEAQKDGPSEIFPGEVEDVISGADE
jgi:hypothetical protein